MNTNTNTVASFFNIIAQVGKADIIEQELDLLWDEQEFLLEAIGDCGDRSHTAFDGLNSRSGWVTQRCGELLTQLEAITPEVTNAVPACERLGDNDIPF